MYRFFGLITVVSSSIASTISWGSGENITPKQQVVLSSITTLAAISVQFKTFIKFQKQSIHSTAKAYAKLQNKIEGVGNINPLHRNKTTNISKKTQDRFDQISDNRVEI